MIRFPFVASLAVIVLGALPGATFAAPVEPAAPRPDAQTNAATSNPDTTSIDALLAADGSLQIPSDFSGSLNVKGWALQTMPDGRPRFIREETTVQATLGGDENWDDRFTNNGTDNQVHTAAIWNGDLYIGGSFRTAGPIVVNNIARYSPATSTWMRLANGVNDTVQSLAVSGATLYLGGRFTRLCRSVDCLVLENANGFNRLAAWNGTDFLPLENGVNAPVYALAANASNLFIGGEFGQLCVNADCTATLNGGYNALALWNGTTFSPLNNGVNFPVFDLAITGDASLLYLGGTFNLICGSADCGIQGPVSGINRVAAWDGTSFLPLGFGVNSLVTSLAIIGSTLYLGGGFDRLCLDITCATDQPAAGFNRIASWNGTSFVALGNGISGFVNFVSSAGSTVYFSGLFNAFCADAACSTEQPVNGANLVATWNGLALGTVGFGVNGSVTSAVESGGVRYLAGNFSAACVDAACSATLSPKTYGVARLDGSVLTALGSSASNSANAQINAVAIMNGDIYVGGFFSQLGPIHANRIGKYSPATNTWSTLGNGIAGNVLAMATDGTTLYLGGFFSRLCDDANCTNILPASGLNNLAAWNGTAFTPIGNGTDDYITSLAISGSNLYFGGGFQRLCADADCSTTLPQTGTNFIASWNGTTITPLAMGLNSIVNALAIQSNTLYLGGSFTSTCTDVTCTTTAPANGINRAASWNGAAFSALANGLDGQVTTIATSATTVYLGGLFTRRCTNADCSTTDAASSIRHLARWNGSILDSLGFGVNRPVRTIAVSGSTLYIGGDFDHTCANVSCTLLSIESYNRVASWNGSTFGRLGNGVNGQVFSMVAINGDIFIGGLFSVAGQMPSLRFARWGEIADLTVSVAGSDASVTPGTAITYTVSLTNNGPATAMNSILTLLLPANATLVSTLPSAGTCTGTGPVSCSFGDLPSGQLRTVVVAMTTSTVGTATLTALADSSQVDPATSTNMGTASIMVAGPLPPVYPILLPLAVSQANITS